MEHSHRYVLVACVLAASACNASSLPSAAPATQTASLARHARSWILPEAKTDKDLLYVADPTESPSYSGHIAIIAIHGLKYVEIGEIEDDNNPQGLTTDAAGNLYVTDLGVATEGPAAGAIKVYPKGSTSYSRLIVPAQWIPFDIAVDGGGTMYVANIAPFASFSPGSVSIYPPSASQPSRVLRLKNFQVDGITLHDGGPSLYISYQAAGASDNGEIAEFKNARGKAHQFGVTFPEPWGLLEDGNDNLLAADGSGTIEVYAETSKKLVQQIAVPHGAMFEAFNTKRTHLFVSNFDEVEVLSYPAGNVLGTIDESWNEQNYPTGVAYWPPPK
jgi:DNA-binding beta-propeller fold protein YncE